MFKHILLLSAVLALTQCQPVPDAEDESNIKNPCPNCIKSQVSSENVDNEAFDTTAMPVSQDTDAASQFNSEFSNIGSQFATQVNSTASQISNQVRQQYQHQKATVGQVIDRLSEAARLTIIEERESIIKALKSIGTATKHTLIAGFDAAQSGFDIILIVPKFALNALDINKPTTA